MTPLSRIRLAIFGHPSVGLVGYLQGEVARLTEAAEFDRAQRLENAATITALEAANALLAANAQECERRALAADVNAEKVTDWWYAEIKRADAAEQKLAKYRVLCVAAACPNWVSTVAR